MGIVQGHAYSVLRLEQIDSFRLLQLRNPHGSRGVEWKGDWADDSERWTKRYMQKLGHSRAEDGVFWMEVEDFVDQFSNLYLCHILSPALGWKKCELSGEWRG